jgi:hypothetical protein
MDERTQAEEHLRVIRTLVERTSAYRAVSARTALIAGVLSLIAATLIVEREIWAREFALLWLVILVVVLCASAVFLSREAQRDRRPMISGASMLALRSVLPCLLPPAAITVWFLSAGYISGQELLLVGVWIMFYGLALLATSLFAPRSLAVLGWAFVLSAMALPVLSNVLSFDDRRLLPAYLMGATFGGMHLVYALSTWRRKGSGARAIATE